MGLFNEHRGRSDMYLSDFMGEVVAVVIENRVDKLKSDTIYAPAEDHRATSC